MNKASMAAVGDRDSVMLWNAVGVKAVFATERDDIERALNALAREGTAIIFITEPAARRAKEEVDKFKTQAFPAIIPIPSANGSDGLGVENIIANVEKAIGSNILLEEDKQ